MKLLLLIAAFAHAAYCGNVRLRASNLLTPAGVTYVDGSYHAGLAAGPLTYSTPVSQPIFQSASDAAPVAYAGPVSKYAAIPTVQHVPGVAEVPVTRINAEPTVIQKTVDVARPAVKTQRYEVRRPAIQKQFYDIEERVVVRPAGSAVVELDEPLSRTQKGPTVIRPTGGDVAVSSAVAVPVAPVAAPVESAVSPAPAELPSVEINLARSSASSGIARNSFADTSAPVEVRASVTPAPASFAAPAPAIPVGFARSGLSASAPASSIEVRSSFPAPTPAPISYSAPFADHAVRISSIPIKTVSVPAPIQTTITGVSSISSGVSGISDVSFSTPAPQYPQNIASTPAPQLSDDSVSIDSADFARSRGLSRSYPGPQTYAAPAPAPAPAPSHEAVFRSEVPSRQFTGQSTAAAAAAARSSLFVNYPNPIDLIPQSRFRSAPVYEGNLQAEINHDNQQKLIQLLTARGGVSEVGLGRSGPASYPVEAGQVRARVLSATPAPAYAAPTGERVNTRRVVVSRPIETLQEVEVAEPVTKYERVRVDQPALVKTASQDIVRVPTSVPVYGKTLAPIAEAPVASIAAEYSADWH